LKTGTAALSNSVSQDEELALSSLSSGQREWQQRVSRELANSVETLKQGPATAGQERRMKHVAWKWAFAASLLLVTSGVVSWLLWPVPEREADRLIAEAYSKQRTIELRMGDAKHGPLRIERGAGVSRMSHPEALLHAEALVAKEITAHPDAPFWLQARGRIDLLEGNYDAAIVSLHQALDHSPESREIKTDLASAYFQRAEQQEHPVDYRQSLELLSKALEREKDEPVALFNRAVVLERLYLYSQAVGDWQHYLRVEPSGLWAEEARQRLKSLESKIELRRGISREHLKSPEELFNENQLGAERRSQLDLRAEDYLDRALQEWLPHAFPKNTGTSASGSRLQSLDATRELSIVLARNHGDRFLIDLLSGASQPHFAEAIGDLARAIKKNSFDDEKSGLDAAQRSANLFGIQGNQAGRLRALFEQAYALQFFGRATECKSKAAQLAFQSAKLHYVWLHVQALLQEGFCSNIGGRPGEADAFVREALELAKATDYSTLTLRALTGLAGLEWEAGSTSEAWRVALHGLGRYWSGEGATLRGFSFYSILDVSSESDRQWLLEECVLRESLNLPAADLPPLQEAVTRYRLANAAFMANHDDVALAQFREAIATFAEAPKTTATLQQEVVGIIGLARVEMRRGNAQHSLQLLQDAASRLSVNTDVLNSLDYSIVLGGSQRLVGDIHGSDSAFARAISICEQAAATLKSRRDQLSWSRRCSEPYRVLTQSRFLEGNPREGLRIWTSYRSLGGMKSVGPEWDRRAATNLSKSTFLVYAQFRDGLAIWILDDRGLHSSWQKVSEEEFTSVATRFARNCSDPSSDFAKLREDARTLYRWLVKPVEGYLDAGRSLVWIPDDSATEIPIAAFVDSGGNFLGARYTTLSSPWLFAGTDKMTFDTVTAQDSILLLAPTEFESELKSFPLKDADREVEDIGSRFQNSTILKGQDASWSALQRNINGKTLLHYAGHSDERASGTALILAKEKDGSGPGRLSANEIGQFRFRKFKLVVLSACATDRGEGQHWLDRESLAFAFVDEGVPRVVATRWRTDSQAASRMMVDFYGHLLQGETPEGALRSASKVLRERSETSHPYFWASFDVFGSEEQEGGAR
jgi:CHAT domain-containing protein